MLRNIISRPDTPWQGFWQGFGGASLTMGVPLVGMAIQAGKWRALAIVIPVALGCGLIGGLWLAIWRLVQGRAYSEIAGGDD